MGSHECSLVVDVDDVVVGDWNLEASPKLSVAACSLGFRAEDCHREDSRSCGLSEHVDVFTSQVDFVAFVVAVLVVSMLDDAGQSVVNVGFDQERRAGVQGANHVSGFKVSAAIEVTLYLWLGCR